MTRLILLLALFNISCAQIDSKYRVNPELEPYLEDFYAAAADRGISIERENLVVEFKSLDSSLAGNCKKHRQKDLFGQVYEYQRTIEIDPSYWSVYGPDLRLKLMAHEAGHCFFDRDHAGDSCSIMSTPVVDCHQDIDDLFDVFFNI